MTHSPCPAARTDASWRTGRSKSAVSAVDKHVGARIRGRRMALGLSQQHLADHVGVTFELLQKLERGASSVGVSRLYLIALQLEAPLGFFFEGLSHPGPGEGLSRRTVGRKRPAKVQPSARDKEITSLAEAFDRILDGESRKSLLNLVEAISMSAGGGPDR